MFYAEKEYSGVVKEMKDNIAIETLISEGHVSLSAPVDFVDKSLLPYSGREVKVVVTVEIKDVI